MQTIETVRSEEDFRAKLQRALDQELSRAAAGLTPTVSTKAAAQYLGVHFDTLGEWRRRSPPLGPPFQKGAGSLHGGANQHVRYLYEDLVEWQRARLGRSAKERRLVAEEDALRQQIRELERELAVKTGRTELEKLKKAVGKGVSFLSLRDCVSISHGWVMSDGCIAGHVLSVSEDLLDRALDEGNVWDASLSEALLEAWVSVDAREPYDAAMSAALDEVEKVLRVARSSARQDALDDSLPEPARPAKDVGGGRFRF